MGVGVGAGVGVGVGVGVGAEGGVGVELGAAPPQADSITIDNSDEPKQNCFLIPLPAIRQPSFKPYIYNP